MTDTERWALNQKFLDEAIARGDEIFLSNSFYEATAGTFQREINYLTSKGLKPSADSMRMLPPTK